MSHIDSFKHELVGHFGHLPVYHPLQDIEGDFISNPDQLVLGGGSGEHPALVFESLPHAVALFLEDEIKTNKKIGHWHPVIKPLLNKPIENLLTYYEWNQETHEKFEQFCRSFAMLNEFMGKTTLEKWLLLGIGEFVFFSLPHMAKTIMEKLENPYQHFYHIKYNNIMIVPPNFPVYANGGNMFFK
jgi:hypothetical protein